MPYSVTGPCETLRSDVRPLGSVPFRLFMSFFFKLNVLSYNSNFYTTLYLDEYILINVINVSTPGYFVRFFFNLLETSIYFVSLIYS